MKTKITLTLVALLCCFNINVNAQDEYSYDESSEFKFGICKHVAVGASLSTLGVGFEVATDITKFFALRAGVNFMPAFNLKGDLDVDIDKVGGNLTETTVQAEGSFKRTTGELLIDFYPLGGTLFLTGGFSFGGGQILKVKAHSDELANSNNASIIIDKYNLPVDENGDANGEIRVKNFRPYLGIGLGGRAVPKGRLSFRTELGVQFHGKPKVTAGGQDLVEMAREAGDDDISKVVDKLVIYPVIKLRLCGRIF